MRLGFVLAALLLLAGCMSAPPPATPASITLLPDASGLGIAGQSQRIDFRRAPEGVIAALDRELGAHQALTLTNCPTGIVQQLDWQGLVLTFTDEEFVGWRRAGQMAGRVCTPAT